MVKRTTDIFEFDGLYLGARPITSIYYVDADNKTHNVWESISNCFSAGYWNASLAWTNSDAWVN